jgi:aminopeptidase N
MIRWLQTKLNCPFPWPKYYQVASPAIRGAMENISLVSWSCRFLMDETWAKERKHYMDSVNIHEMGMFYFL